MAKDRSFANKLAKAEHNQEEQTPTALVVRPVKSVTGHYKFKRVIAKMTKENKQSLGI
ncbi:MAG: hypothetical protein QGI34_00735 [Candidatus Latescibacteria bacterium]|jgi:hypothetical protein|nr:hypothetical protein [Candidatus Latescibacterota bacterium]|tara:strand:+ start:272 stop:445 length:174 start_codon:yes stop_codon:yes gene_type:complete